MQEGIRSSSSGSEIEGDSGDGQEKEKQVAEGGTKWCTIFMFVRE